MLEVVFADEDALRRHVEERLDADVTDLSVLELDYVRDITRVAVRYTSRPPLAPAPRRSSTSPSATAERFAPVGLGELEGSAAALLDRVDRKYVVPVETFAALAERLVRHPPRARDRRHARRSATGPTYYDTPGLDAYRDHVQRRRPALQVPLARATSDSGLCAFEVKLKGARGRTVKHRMPYEEALHGTLSPEALRFLHERLLRAYGRGPGDGLLRTLDMYCRRLTLADVERGERLTVRLRARVRGRRPAGRRRGHPGEQVAARHRAGRPCTARRSARGRWRRAASTASGSG